MVYLVLSIFSNCKITFENMQYLSLLLVPTRREKLQSNVVAG